MGLNFVDSIYFTVSTIATLGYGDIVPLTVLQKVFSFTLAIGGVGLVAYVFSLIISLVSQWIEEWKSDTMIRKIKSLEDHYILCGYGRVGAVVVAELQKRNHEVVIIEKNRDIVDEIEKEGNLLVMHGDATDDKTLKCAGIEKATGLLLATGNDVENLFITLASREISKDLWIVSRALKKENIHRIYNSGANEVVSPAESGGEDIYFAAIKSNIISITTKHDAKDIKREMKIIINHGCSIETIEYYYPYSKKPLKRRIGAYSQKQLDRFLELLEQDKEIKKSLELIYESVNGVHSHLISGPNQKTLDKVVESLEKENLVIGVNLNHKEIMEITRKPEKVE